MLLRLLGALILIAVLVIALVAFLTRSPGPAPVDADLPASADRLVEAAGQTWRVREEGPADAPALILIHGFSHSLETWDAWAEDLTADYRVIRFDLPGHGLTGPREDEAYSVSDTVDQVAGLLAQIAPERFILGGSSLGGLVSWRYAALHPERVEALVLVSPGGYPIHGVSDEPAPLPLPVRIYLTTAPEVGVRAATRSLYADPSLVTDEQVARIRAMMRTPGVPEALVARIEQFTLPDPEPDLARVTAPALLLWGAADAMVPAEHGPRFAAALPDARLVVLENVGHMPMEEAPQDSLQVVRNFLAGLTAGLDD
ncbi:alpha/beta fold hydrolase [Alkalicaulis satelles]|uniref:Alpha/beta fold hydrolase n=1 Tax=Alkalicaulis satelles TaxID=2609175 RepID=A0A5M6ZR45_9PROT|nr:alpha/beta fold hydrolase [Alkalicaulis satelles]KAA5804751.1 alpha/beta fold hydrolase [Alkalicaulis satelles]